MSQLKSEYRSSDSDPMFFLHLYTIILSLVNSCKHFNKNTINEKNKRDMNIFAAPGGNAPVLSLFWVSEFGEKEVRHTFKLCIYNNMYQE